MSAPGDELDDLEAALSALRPPRPPPRLRARVLEAAPPPARARRPALGPAVAWLAAGGLLALNLLTDRSMRPDHRPRLPSGIEARLREPAGWLRGLPPLHHEDTRDEETP